MIKWKDEMYEDPGLPPPEMRLLDPHKERIVTPTDDRGLVIIPALIAAVKATIRPEHKWSKPYDVHHFQWPAVWYPYRLDRDTRVNPEAFRELPIHKGLVPRAFHNWLHVITIPPPLPDEEIMHYRIEAWSVARALFSEVRNVVQWERRMVRREVQLARKPDTLPAAFNGVDIIGREIMAEVLASNFKGMERQLARLDSIPEEHRLFEPSDSPSILAATLGKLVVPRSMSLIQAVAV